MISLDYDRLAVDLGEDLRKAHRLSTTRRGLVAQNAGQQAFHASAFARSVRIRFQSIQSALNAHRVPFVAAACSSAASRRSISSASMMRT